uniref:Nebulin isoform X21 n=1 Tax=Geotrypetes seraphini TaxID=260995 RepID=A0A6P8QR21_GEOSA|nr:nebulin isoform X21 [Geotrypetes seraphini]
MADDEEYEEEVEYYMEKTVTQHGGPTVTHKYVSERSETVEPSTAPTEVPSKVSTAEPTRKRLIRKKVDSSKFMTPYLAHSHKMQDLFSQLKYKENYEKNKGQSPALTADTPELRRIKKVQQQLSEVKYRMEGDNAKTLCHVDGTARDIEHAKKVSQQVSKVLYKQNWEDTKDKYLLPPDAPELVQAIKNTSNVSKKLYTADWEEDKALFYPYSDSPELRRVAKAQKALSDIVYKKGHDEQKSKFTPIAHPLDVELAKKMTNQRSDHKYREDYEKKIKGRWTQTPCYDVAVAKMNSENISMKKYQENYENLKDQIHFVQTETPEYNVNKRAAQNASTIQYKKEYEKAKGPTGYHVLPATQIPLLRQLKHAGEALSDVLYKQNYEKAKGKSINYCETPKFKLDTVLKNFNDTHYKDKYHQDILGRYVGSFEDPHMLHCLKLGSLMSDKRYKADYEEDKDRCYFPQTITQGYDIVKKLDKIKDPVYRQRPDKVQYTQVADTPVLVQAQVNSKQLSDMNYKAKHEQEKSKCHIPSDAPFILQSRLNAYNLSDTMYKYDWENSKSKSFDIKIDAIPLMVAKANSRISSDVAYKKDYEKSKGKMVGALSIHDDPKILHSVKVAQIQSDLLYKQNYEKTKGKSINYCETPKYQLDTVLKNFNDTHYKDNYHQNVLGRYVGSFEDPHMLHCLKVGSQRSDKMYKADYEDDKGRCYFPQTITQEYEMVKKLDKIKDPVYRQRPDKVQFTQVADSPVLVQAQVNSKQLSDMNYKAKHEQEKSKCHIPSDAPFILQSRLNAYNLSDTMYKYDWERLKSKNCDIKIDAIPLKMARANSRISSDVAYKKDYEKSKGKMVGALSIHDDPKMLHSVKVAQIQSDLLYKQNYEKTKGKSINYCETPKYQLDNVLKNFNDTHYKDKYHQNVLGRYIGSFEDPHMLHCLKVGSQRSDKMYKADYEEDKARCYFPQTITQEYETAKKLDNIKDHVYRQHPNKVQFTQVADSPVLLQAQLNSKQLSDMNYKAKHEQEKSKCHIPSDVPFILQSRLNAYNLSDTMYKYDWERIKAKNCDIKIDAIPLKMARANSRISSDVAYKKDYEKSKGKMVGALSIHDDPKILHSVKVAQIQSDLLYKQDYEKTKGKSINYCETPKYQLDAVLKNFNDVHYKDKYQQDVLGRYIGSFEDPHMLHCLKVGSQRSDKMYKADYEDDKARCFFPQTITQEYEAVKKLDKIKDPVYRQHPDKVQFTQVADSPVLVQAQLNSKQLSDMNYKAKHEQEKSKCHIPSDAPFILQSRHNAYNLSDTWYKYDWETTKSKKFDIKIDAIPLVVAKANSRISSDVAYKKDYEKSKGKLVGALSVQDDPKMLHSMKVAKIQSDLLYKENYEKTKGKSINYCETPQYQLDIVLKNFNDIHYKDKYQQEVLGRYIGSFEDPHMLHCLKVGSLRSDKIYKAEYEDDKARCFFPQTITQEYEAVKNLDKIKDPVYRQHPDKVQFTQVTDSPVLVQAQLNSKQLSDMNYKAKHEQEKSKCHIPSDAPFILQSRHNAYNLSDTWYKYDWERTKSKKFDIKIDAIPIVAARANSRISSDVAYKKDYEKSKGKMVGALSIQDDPKMLHSVKMAHIQSDIEYKKDYEKTKAKYTAPLDMVEITSAKKAQAVASDIDYKHLIHNYAYPPDSVSLSHAKKAYTLQSDVDYRADYNSWMKGCGWVPYESLEMENAKKASQIISETKYRQHPDTIKFTAIEDAPIIVQSKINQAQRSDVAYKAKGEEIIHKYTLPPDLPEFLQAKVNAYNLSNNYYKMGLEELKSKGYDLRIDALPIRVAKAARRAASEVQYRKDYESQKGKLVGFRSLQDDPKLVHYMNVAKMQSEREYKKDYEKTKTKYNTPLDMFNVTGAKKAQEIASNANYKQLIHHYTYLPDAMSLQLSRNQMQIQSDNVYKSDYNSWMKGIGWLPIGSLDVETAKKAGDALSEKKYRQHPDTIKFTSVVDSPVMVQAKINALQLNDKLYKASGEKFMHKYNLTPDVPAFIQARYNALHLSDAYYKHDWHQTIAKGHKMLSDAIPIVAAKASRNIASDYKYREAYEKAKGHHVGFRSLQDDPKLVHYMNVAKMQSEREYKKDYEQTKTKYHTPSDMFSITAAKKSQEVASDVDYKRLVHHYTYLPDAMSVQLSRNRMEIQSDNLYKADYNSWFKGIGWMPLGSLDFEKVKKAGEALNENKYRQHPDTIKFSSIPDSMNLVLAQANTKQQSDLHYKASGEKFKHKYTLTPDHPDFIQAKVNALNLSHSYYKADWNEHLAKGYDLRSDAIPIVAAKASRNIASDFKYKEAYQKEKGKQVGFRSLQDDPKLVHYMQVAKMQSDREYKKEYEKSKTRYQTPVDMLSVKAAKQAQEAATNMNYKQLIHNYTLLPDAMNLELSRNRMQLQSDNLYKADFNNWLKGVGWIPIGSLDDENAKRVKVIVSEKNYRQHPDKLKYTIDIEAMDQVLAKSNALIMNKRAYIEAWNKDKTKIHVMPDTPEILLSRVNQLNLSDKLYRHAWEEDKKKGYDLRPDAIPLKAAKASRDIISDYKYKQAFHEAKGKQIGFRSLQDDPLLVHFMKVAKIQSEREYKKDYEKTKTKFHSPVDMLSVKIAKQAQEVTTNINYKQLIHDYRLMPDAISFELARNRQQIHSDAVYKSEYNDYLKGVGWMPLGSLEDEKNKKAMEAISESKYRQHPNTFKFSSLMDSMDMTLAQNNAKTMNKHLYKEAWEADKTKIHIMPDMPEILLAKVNAYNISEKQYRSALEEEKKKGYDLRVDAIPIKAAKASRDIASNYKYKESYEKDKGKLVGLRSIQDDPLLVHYMKIAKIQSEREYKKDYEKTKTRYQTPLTMLSVTAAKDAQAAISEINYRHLIHKYVLLPDAQSLQLAKSRNQLQSDNEYKQEYNTWYKGMGWVPIGSLDVEKSKRASEILSEAKYRQHPSQFHFTSLTDSMEMELAKQNAHVMNKRLYIDAWEKDKKTIHVMPDTPDIVQAKLNKTTFSQKQYRLGWEEVLKKGYDLRPDAMSITAAKASRDIASDYKYKTAYRKQQGHHVGFRSLQDDPKSVWAMYVAKIQSDREYKKDFEKWRTKFNMPVDMLDILLAKKCQTLVSDIDYRHYLHNWTCLPDQNDVVHAKKVHDIQSDILYKSEYNDYMKGIGWMPLGSLEDEKNKKAMEAIRESKYRQHPDKFKFSRLMDSMDMVLAQNNAVTMNKKLYTEAWDKDKIQIHVMPDTPEILQAKVNLINQSDKIYRSGYEELKKKGYDLRPDAISVTAAKASRDIASDYKYKAAYRKQQGHHVGFRSLQDDPKSVWAMHVAKMQSDREYKKDYEKWRTKFNTPVDMLGIQLAKKCQTLVSDIDYKHYLHNWTCLPDQNDVVHARKAYELHSDIAYKSDLQWLKGIGWLPVGSLDDEKNKRASMILSEKNYRQHPDTVKFTSVTDSLEMELARANAEIMNRRLYVEAWNKDKNIIHVMPDTPEILLAKQNKINMSDKLYRLAMEEDKKKGYDLRSDAIPIQAAKASRDIASDYKYKTGYRKQLGHHVGFRSLQDDPKLVWSIHVAKIQSDRVYKKDFEKWRTKFNSPVDMLGLVLAKKCQILVSDIDYKHPLHQWTCLPDQNDVIHARKAYELQSDNLYKSDLSWLKGIGWVPIGSLDVEKTKRAGEILSEHKYRQHPSSVKFTSVTDSLELQLAKVNAETMNKRLYTEAWNKDKTIIHIMPDTPEIVLARQNKINCSDTLYKVSLEDSKKKGYDLRMDAIPIQAAKASRNIASDYLYKTAYRKQLGHHIGYRCLQDDPRSVLAANVAKMQSEREYKKEFERWKTKFNSPVDMLGLLLAKKCQTLVSDIDYKHPLHQWTCLPDQNDVIHARKAYELQSDNLYKSDLLWLKGIGWVPIGSMDAEKNKRAGEILSEKNYRQHPSTVKFTSVTDSLELQQAKLNAEIMNKHLYIEAWENDKRTIHVMPDTPEILLAKSNRINFSDKIYKHSLEESKKKGYDLRTDAIPIKSAKASRDIASDYKYKAAYRQQLGHYVGFRSLEDDPKSVWAIHVGKIQSDRVYKKDFEKTKTRFSSPVDMLGILLAKNCQKLVTDIDYRNYLHQWTCLPDQNDVIQAKKAYELQSDAVYKSDMEWMRGIGWVPIGSLDVENAKRAGKILSEKSYRQPPETFKFTPIPDTLELVLAKNNALQMSKHLYREAWDIDKRTIHVMPDTPEIELAKSNSANISDKLYKQGWEDLKQLGYDLRVDAIPFKTAKKSREIASDYKYKEAYQKQRGHHVGFRTLEDDPKSVWAIHVAKIQSEREYKKDFEKSKTRFSSPVDMLAVVMAKTCQKLVSDIDYRNYLHQWTCLPDQNDIIQAKKAYNLQSDMLYKSDLEWIRGCGWMPNDSIEVNRVKNAQEILNERLYRQPPEKLKFTSIVDLPAIVLAKTNAEQISEPLYREAWDKEKVKFTLPADTPQMLQSKVNAINISNKLYQEAWEEAKRQGYDLRSDAISIQSAKAARDIASQYKYLDTYQKQKGHYIGSRTVEDDPKLKWLIHSGTLPSNLKYKEDYEKTKAKIHLPADMVSLLSAKQCQTLVSDIDYRQYLHQWTCHPDQNDCIQARKAYDLQSDALYKSDLEWLRGIGWIPNDSIEVNRVKNAQDILNERLYRLPPQKLKYTSIVDLPSIVLAKTNSEQISDWKYREMWDKEKTDIHVMPDTPEIMLSRANAINVSNKLYRKGWDEVKMVYDLRADAIPITAAKASREIASDYKYKLTHEKQKGHYVGCPTVEDDTKLSWLTKSGKLHNNLTYKEDYEKTKAKIHLPVDMVSVLSAKQCQTLVSDIDYRHYLHQWTCHPDQNDCIQARKAYDLQSDAIYKSDLEWLRGIGWIPNDSIEVNRVKNAQDILNERLYRLPPQKLKYTSIVDLPSIVLARTNAEQISDWRYREMWEKEKTDVHVMPDTPEIMLSRANAINVSNKLYRKGWDEVKMVYDLRADAIPITAAKASREIASDYKYKLTHEKQKGHYIGCPTVEDDTKLSWLTNSGKLHSNLAYKEDYEKTKARIHLPADMVSLLSAKQCQTLVSDIDYRQYLHQWTCHPDQNDCIQARKAYDLQSDAIYKCDLEWLRGIGWMPNDSIEVNRVKHAQDILNEKLYRLPPQKLKYTSIVDLPSVILARTNAEQISDWKYREMWEKEKTDVHVMPDTPEIMLSRANAINVSNKLYRKGWDEVKMVYDLRADAIPITAAKASREIASDYKYKLTHEKQKGHYIGCPTVEDDTKLSWLTKSGKLHNNLTYKEDYEKTKAKIHLPVDMVSVLSAKQCQTLVSDIDYRQYLHQWTCHPDQNDCIQARKAYDLQSDAIYKSDLEWLRGIGWIPSESPIVKRVKHAQDLISEQKYRTKPETLEFTPVTDRVDYVTAKQVAEMLSNIKYREAWNTQKMNYTLTETPLLITARNAAKLINNKLYKEGWEKTKAISYELPVDAIPITHAKHGNEIQSELKYKSDYVKQKGHYVGLPTMKDDPKLMWFKHVGLMQNEREYQKLYQKYKAKITIPGDMVAIHAAKDGQLLASDIDYRHYLHEWTCHPDQNDCIQARKAYDLQSDNLYKSDLEWIRGCGWIPLDSVEHRKVKRAQELVNERIYKQDARSNYENYTHVVDPPAVVLAKMNAVNQSDVKYKETFNRERGHFIGSAETPQLTHSKEMARLSSNNLYKSIWEGGKAFGYHLPPDYIPIVGAKHANLVSSELKYKEIYEKQKGHYLAGTHISDFPGVVHSLSFQKMRSLLPYKQNYEDNKAKIHIPNDMLHNILVKRCQHILSDIEYRRYLHEWTCSPEENDVIQAKKAHDILSDVLYKDDLNWLKGIGCYVWDTPQILHAKKAYDLQSQILYTAPGKENLPNYNMVTDTPVYVTAVKSGTQASEVKYKENYHKIKDKYTTVLETVDYNRTHGLKDLFSSNIYKHAWDKIKAKSYKLPSDSFSLAINKRHKNLASYVKYREEYEKFKALYTIPKGVQEDPNTARCLRVGKLNIDRLYKEGYEKNKMKIHIVPDMLEIVTARKTQDKVSYIDYRKYLHEWICLPDLKVYVHARKVNEQLSDISYKDDLNWLKGIGCFVWDTPEILRAKHAYDLRNDITYKSQANEMKKNYSLVTDTPLYRQAVTSGKQSSDVVYHSDYEHKIRGKVAPTTKTVDLDRAKNAHKLQSEYLYREAGVHFLPKGYKLPADLPSVAQAKKAQLIGSDLKYKEAYEHLKASGYTLGPNDVPMVYIKKVNKILNERMYRQLYHQLKDKIHTTPDTPEIRQVKATQEAVSDLIYKSHFFKMRGHMISMPFTPQLIHHRHVGEITSDNKYKEDLQWLRGLGCFLFDTPDMVRARFLRKLWSHYVYTTPAKKMQDKYSTVLDTPEYRRVQELKTHLSEVVYRAKGNKQKTKFTSILNTPDFLRAKKGQQIQSQYLYVEVASKQRPHHHANGQTPIMKLARHVKDMVSEKKYKLQYERLKHKYTTVADTPILIRAKKAYWNASDLRYKETFESQRGKYHTVKDALDIVYHRRVTDDISSVNYKKRYMSELGFWRSIPDRPEHFHHRAVTDSVSDYKYKEDLTWLKGIGCYVWDTPDLVLAEQNKTLYSMYKYREAFQKIKSQFQETEETPLLTHFKHATELLDAKKYKTRAKSMLQQGCNEILRPDLLRALFNTKMWSQWRYKELYEKHKDKFTSLLDTPEYHRAHRADKQISEILYKLEYNRAKPKGYTTIHDTPLLLHMRGVKDKISELKYKELYVRSKGQCNLVPDAVEIKAAKKAYKFISNLDYKTKYEATKAHWIWTADRPDFVHNAKTSLQQSDYEYKLDREFLKGCKLSVTDDKNTVLALKNAEMNSDVKYKERYEKGTYRGAFEAVPDTPQIIHAKSASSLASETKYKKEGKKLLPFPSFTTLPETQQTAHVKEVTKILSEKNYKKKFEKERGKSNYSIMMEPPEVKHAMDVAKCQSNVAYKKDARDKQHFHTPIADRPDIQKATQVAKLSSELQYKKRARGEAGHGITILDRPDIELAKEVSKLTSQVKYKENFSKDKGKRPQYNLKESKIYQTLKDAHTLASDVKYKAENKKKIHKPVTDMSESLNMHHITSTSRLASDYQYKKEFQKSKGHYHVVPDTLEQLHVKEATELQSQVKYKEKYEKERGKAMLDFETPTYVTAKEAQQMQSEKEYKKDLEEYIKGKNLAGLETTPSLLHVRYATKIASEKEYRKDFDETIRGKGLTIMDETPDLLRAKNATQILNEKEYKKALELEIKGRGLSGLALETPDFMRAKNANDIASQIKYKHLAEMDKANYTTVVDTPEIIHAQQVKDLPSKKKYKEDAERTMPYYVSVLETPEMQRVRENQKNFSTLQYQCDLKNIKGKVTVVKDTPEILRVKENQKNFSSVLYKEDIGTGTPIEATPEMKRIKRTQDAISTIKYKEHIGQGTSIPDLPEVKRVKETQKHISSVLYKEMLGVGTPTPATPEMERVKRNQENISSVLYKEGLGQATPIPVTPEMERVKQNQENISSVSYKESLGVGTPTPVTPEMERVRRNQENISLVLYKENVGTGTPTTITPEIERVKRNQENFSLVLYKDSLGIGTPTPVTPEMERVKRNQENISSVLYKESLGQATPTPVTPEMERVKRNQENISSVLYKESLGKATSTPVTPEMERVKRNQEHISLVSYREDMGKATPTPVTPEMERVRRNQENISSVLYSDSFRKQVQGKAAFVLDTPEMRRVRQTQRNISTVKYHEDFEKHKGSFTPVVTDPITERVKKNMQDFSDINYRGIQRRVVEMARKRTDQDQENATDLRVWRTNPGSIFDYDPAEDNIQSRSLHMLSVQAQRRSREHSRSASALSLSAGDEKSDASDHHLSYYSNGGLFTTTTTGYKQAKTTELPQQRSSSVATQQTTVSSVPSHPSTVGKTFRAVYDYMAVDDDEVSFKDGDAILNVQAIDEGWMYGTVQRTGKTGMLPANYVEAI